MQTSVLSEMPIKIAPLFTRKHVRLGSLAVEICNPETGEKKSIFAFHDTGSQMTLLWKLTVDEIGLHGKSYIQSCRRMIIKADVLMEGSSLLVRRLTENKFHSQSHVRMTDHVPSLEHSLLNTLELEEHPNFFRIEYPTLDRN